MVISKLKEFQKPVVTALKHAKNRVSTIELPQSSGLYFIGIGGVGMSSVARLLKNRGYAVSGSDILSNLATASLKDIGVKINFQQNGLCIDNNTDLIVTSAAIPDNNLDLIKAKRLGIKIIKYSQLLGLLMKDKKGIAVSGTHGKTTTTAMISTILKTAGLDPTCVIGGDTSEFNGNRCLGSGDLFVLEACEYDRTFLNLTPQMAVITNIEEDHLDYYKDIKELRSAFAEFASSIYNSGLLVINEQDYNILKDLGNIKCEVESYAIVNGRTLNMDYNTKISQSEISNLQRTIYSQQLTSGNVTWGATVPVFRGGKSHFKVFYKGTFFGDFYILTPGVHNVMNALASIAICCHAGVHKDFISNALSSFKGVNRRFQVLGAVNDIIIIDDYAHHPTAIQTTLNTARDRYPDRRIWCLFQPHQYSRTKLLLERFVKSFTHADKIILTDIYPARDSLKDRESVNSSDVAAKIKKMGLDVKLIHNHSNIVDILCEGLLPGDVLIVMGAGDIWRVATKILKRLRSFGIKELSK